MNMRLRIFALPWLLLLPCAVVDARAEVTLYGIVDAALAYSSNQAGASSTYIRSGNLAGSRIGFKGTEALGDGRSVIFQLENGYDVDTGAQSSATTLFNRQAFVGLADDSLGTLTAGRQYTPYYQMLGPVAQVSALTGATGAHPGDLDGFDTTVRVNNSISYATPVKAGLQAGALYGFGEGSGGRSGGSSTSAAVRYEHATWDFALGFQNFRSAPAGGAPASGTFGSSAVTAGYGSAESVQHLAAAVRHAIGVLTVGANISRVRYVAGGASLFRDTAVLRTAGVLAILPLTPAWTVSGALSFTTANRANGIGDPAMYRQVSFEQTYAFSKRTALYFLEAHQRASGQTLGTAGTVAAVATVGDSQNATPSSNGRQSVLMAGLRHLF